MTVYIPYFQTTRYRVQTMIELAHIQPGEKAADLGSGDGRILIAFTKAGARAYGYELDKNLLEHSLRLCKKEGVTTVQVYQTDFWQEDLSQYTIITVYGMPDIMEPLEKKLQKELPLGARVLSNYYPFPTWKETIQKDNIYLYIKE